MSLDIMTITATQSTDEEKTGKGLIPLVVSRENRSALQPINWKYAEWLVSQDDLSTVATAWLNATAEARQRLLDLTRNEP